MARLEQTARLNEGEEDTKEEDLIDLAIGLELERRSRDTTLVAIGAGTETTFSMSSSESRIR